MVNRPELRWRDTVARAYLPYILNLRTLVSISLKTAAIRGGFFQPKIKFTSYVYEVF